MDSGVEYEDSKPPKPVLRVPVENISDPKLTTDLMKAIFKNAKENKKVEFIVQVESIETFCDRYFCEVRDGSGNLFKCYFSRILSSKVSKASILPHGYIKIKKYYLHRFATYDLKNLKKYKKKFFDVIGVSELAIIRVLHLDRPDKRLLADNSNHIPVKVKVIEAAPEKSSLEMTPVKIPAEISPVKKSPAEVSSVKKSPIKILPAEIIPAKIPSSQINSRRISSLRVSVKCSLIRGTIKTFPQSLTENHTVFSIFDSSGEIVCWMYGYIADILRDQIKEGFTLTASDFIVRNAIERKINIPNNSKLELIINSTAAVEIHDINNKCVGKYENPPPLKLESDLNFNIRTAKYPLLHAIIKSHYNKKFDFIAVVVDQTNVIHTSSVTVKHIVIKDESARVDVTLWREIGENFSFPNGAIIIGRNFYTHRKNEVGFTAHDYAKIIMAPKCPDKIRLQNWYRSLANNSTQSQD